MFKITYKYKKNTTQNIENKIKPFNEFIALN